MIVLKHENALKHISNLARMSSVNHLPINTYIRHTALGRHLSPRGSTLKLKMSHWVPQNPQCMQCIPTAAGKMLTDRDRIGKHFVQDPQQAEREGQERVGCERKRGKKNNLLNYQTPRGQPSLMERCHNRATSIVGGQRELGMGTVLHKQDVKMF